MRSIAELEKLADSQSRDSGFSLRITHVQG
jgi:hypothetical protein